MSKHADMERWKRWLHVPSTRTDALYDRDYRIKQHILRAFDFHDEYLSYSANWRTKSRKRLKGEGHKWASSSRIERGLRGVLNVKVLQWNYVTFKNQQRIMMLKEEQSEPSTAKRQKHEEQPQDDPFATHARGVFIDRERSLFVVYEPRAYTGQVNQWFGWPVNDLCKAFQGCTHLLVYGNQENSSDCEKRVIRFGLCYWEVFRSQELKRSVGRCSCGLAITHITRLSTRDK